MDPKRSAVVLYAKSGALGHSSLASAYASLLNENGYRAEAVDILPLDRGPDVDWSMALHFRALNRAPWIWRTLYAHWSSIPGSRWFRESLLPRRFVHTCHWLRGAKPALIVTTHPLATVIASYAKAQGWIDGHLLAAFPNWHFQPFWMCPHVDRYLVVTPGQAQALMQRGVPSDCISQTGMLVDSFFYQTPEPPVSDRPVILVMTGGTGWRVEEFLKIVSRLARPADVYIPGVPQAVRPRLNRFLHRHPPPNASVHLLGPVDVRPYFARADLFIGKPAISLAESVALSLPTVVAFPVPGHDEWAMPEILAATPVIELPTTNPTDFLDTLIASLPDWRAKQRAEASRFARQSPARVLTAIREL